MYEKPSIKSRLVDISIVLIAALVGCIGAVAGARISVEPVKEQAETSAEGMITDRYTAAVENLGHDTMEVRMGGVYALQRIMEDSPRDQPSIANLLASYIRIRPPGDDDSVRRDATAALSVLAMRNSDRDGYFVPNLQAAYLRCVDLQYPPSLDRRPDLKKADFSDAKLTRANLRGADFTDADFSRANLVKSNLSRTDLTEADLSGADLREADLSEADLSNANGWTLGQVVKARITSTTELPQELSEAPAVKARIAEVEAQKQQWSNEDCVS
ncbi:pentapeptide repeat-containing protein [Streptomyces sp. NPDC093094]|uniref:pentapeptide repeat-containing protein n=1 Tax=Streptomyces sp. NPDC093094 TaxID=3366026 RepID=UPI0038029E20